MEYTGQRVHVYKLGRMITGRPLTQKNARMRRNLSKKKALVLSDRVFVDILPVERSKSYLSMINWEVTKAQDE